MPIMRRPAPRLSRLRTNSALDHQQTVERLRTIVFGDQREKWGSKFDIPLTRPLQTTGITQYYPPSKYLHLDFRVDQYMMIQAERHAPFEPAPELQRFRKMMIATRQAAPIIRQFFIQSRITPWHMKKNPTLRDLEQLLSIASGKSEHPWLKFEEQNHSKPQPAVIFKSLLPKMDADQDYGEPVIPSCAEFDTLTATPEISEPNTADREKEQGQLITHLPRSQILRRRHKPSNCITTEEFKNNLDAAIQSGTSSVNIRNRFIDALYRKRRNTFLATSMERQFTGKKMAKNKHYTIHPDALRVFPTHKGHAFVRWPSVHK